MAPHAVDLARLAEERADPGAALSAIATLRDRLNELEDFHVEHARRLGWSWSEIAQRLGISRQAVHHKHARRVADARRADRLAPMTIADVRHFVARATREAAALKHESVGTDHLLLALLADEAVSLPDELGIAPERVREAVAERRAAGQQAPAPAEVPTSSETAPALEGPLREALRLSEDGIGAEHLLLALLRGEDSAASQVLAGLGISTEHVESCIMRSR